MSYLTLEEALKLEGRKFKDLEVPELNGTLRLAELPAGRSLEFKHMQDRRAKGEDLERKQMELLLASALVDAGGKPLLDAKTAGKFIDAVSFSTLNLIVMAVLEMMTVPAKEGQPSGNSGASLSGS